MVSTLKGRNTSRPSEKEPRPHPARYRLRLTARTKPGNSRPGSPRPNGLSRPQAREKGKESAARLKGVEDNTFTRSGARGRSLLG